MTDDQAYKFTVLFEEMKTQMGVMSDGHATLNDKLDVLGVDMRAVKDRLDTMDARLGRIEGDVAVLKTDLGRVKDHVGLNGAGPPARSAGKRKAPAKRK